MAMQHLNRETVRLLSSSQVITSVHAVVKELLENSLDAKATNIEVKLENYGLDLIEVKDNGTGIKKEDACFMALPHYTSKLSDFADLGSLESYGFRGEALTSVAAVANLSITTCTEEDGVALTYTIDHSGQTIATKPSHLGRGTTVSVTNLFRNVPVRKQCYRNLKRCREDLKKAEDVMLAFGIAHPKVRFVLKHNKNTIWQKMQTSDFKTNLFLVLGSPVMQQLTPITFQHFDPMLKVYGYVPKPQADLSQVSRTNAERVFLIVNQRPVVVKPVIQLVRQVFAEAFPSQSGRYPVAVVCIDVLPGDLDVNLEPNKTAVLFRNEEFIEATLSKLLTQVYSPEECTPAEKIPASQVTHCPSEPDSLLEEEVEEKDESTLPSNKLSTSNFKSGEPKACSGTDLPTSPVPAFRSVSSSSDLSEESNSSANHSRAHSTLPDLEVQHEDGAGSIQMLGDESRIGSKDGVIEMNYQGNGSQEFESSSGVSKEAHPFSLPASCDETSKLDDLLQPESYEVLDISDFEWDSDECVSEIPLADPNMSRAHTASSASDKDNLQQNQVTLSAWSRGEALQDTGRQPVEPVKVLQPSLLPLKPVQSKLAYKGPPPIFDMIDSQPVKRKANHSPPPGLRADYFKKRKSSKTSPSNGSGPLSSFLQKSPQKKKKEPMPDLDIPTKSVPCALSEITERNATMQLHESDQQQLANAVIGYCNPPGVWLILLDKNIACFNAMRASQWSLFHKLVSSHKLPAEKLDNPVLLNESIVGGHENLMVLLSLESEYNPLDGCHHLSDECIVKNGFKIYKRIDNGKTQLHLTHVCRILPSYGVKDLRELLGKIRQCRQSGEYSELRPMAVEQFLQRESARMAKSRVISLRRADVEDLFTSAQSEKDTDISLYFHNICTLAENK